MTEKKHVVRFPGPRCWKCTCGAMEAYAGAMAAQLAQSGAERHAFDAHGSIEMGRAS